MELLEYTDSMTIGKLQEVIAANRGITIELERKVAELKELEARKKKPIKPTTAEETKSNSRDTDDNTFESEEDDDIDFQNEVDYYYSLINYMEDDQIDIESIKDILPSKNKTNYNNIILAIKLKLLKSIKEYKDMRDSSTKEIDSDYLRDIRKEIIAVQDKINLIQQAETEEKNNDVIEPIRNNLFFSLSQSGNVSVMYDIEKEISKESYGDFQVLLNSIIDGTFKKVKKFGGNDTYRHIAEVRSYQARIIFDRIGRNNYVIIGAFTKKTDNGRGYKNNLTANVKSYLAYRENIVNNANNEDFIKLNQEYENELFAILNGDKEKNKMLEKGGNN